jgi:hypothetical protein
MKHLFYFLRDSYEKNNWPFPDPTSWELCTDSGSSRNENGAWLCKCAFSPLRC